MAWRIHPFQFLCGTVENFQQAFLASNQQQRVPSSCIYRPFAGIEFFLGLSTADRVLSLLNYKS